jgi:hypothetical protein
MEEPLHFSEMQLSLKGRRSVMRFNVTGDYSIELMLEVWSSCVDCDFDDIYACDLDDNVLPLDGQVGDHVRGANPMIRIKYLADFPSI